jgi:putative hemolysin
MENARLPFQFAPSTLVPAPFQSLIRPLEPALLKILMPDLLRRSWNAADPSNASPVEFADEFLKNLAISYEVQPSDVDRIPATGAGLIVANHPFGILEGPILLSILERVRPDYRIVASTLLASTPVLHQRVIFVNPFEDADKGENGKALRSCVSWLRGGGLLVMFPAGEVSHLNWGERPVADPKWNTTAARLACKMGCPTLPMFFNGANSIPFQMLGTIHPRLRTLNLARELCKKTRHRIDVRIGSPIAASVLESYPDFEAATDYLRARTYLLLNRPAHPGQPVLIRSNKQVAAPACVKATAKEVADLDDSHILASNADFKVLIAGAQEIPNVLHEIGRSREETYRQIGEGTGNSLDLDEFDQYYRHMFLWSTRDQRVAGAYRIVATPDVLSTRGIKGLYTSTLFHFEPDFFHHIGPAVELGRSFIARDYQKQYAPLLLLWKGIARFVQSRPECPVLFGAVSISSDYNALSRTLIVNFLNGHIASNMSGWVKPRRGFRSKPLVPKHVKDLNRLLSSVEELSSSVQDLESDGKGLPVLIRQYLKIGGKMLGFNVDPNFSNALDALVMADLRTATTGMLERCMGRAGAAEFRARWSM